MATQHLSHRYCQTRVRRVRCSPKYVSFGSLLPQDGPIGGNKELVAKPPAKSTLVHLPSCIENKDSLPPGTVPYINVLLQRCITCAVANGSI